MTARQLIMQVVEGQPPFVCVEMAVPSTQMRSQWFYHGTTSREAAIGIARDGLKPKAPPKSRPPSHHTRQHHNWLEPVKGKTYITPHLSYAQIYAIGGDMAGYNYGKQPYHDKDPYGYVFKFHGSKLKDVQPDE